MDLENKELNESVELLETKRKELTQSGKNSSNYAANNQHKGKNRYARRVHSSVMNSVAEFNKINMDKFFKQGILDVSIKVRGETDNYLVKLSFGGIIDSLRDQIKKSNDKFDLRVIVRALIDCFNTKDVYIHCSCPDWCYRFSYWSSYGDLSSDPEVDSKTSKGTANYEPKHKWTNNDMEMGFACKHVLLVLSNNSWLWKVASVIYNYVNYIKTNRERLYADFIYPALYDREYEKDVQLDLNLNGTDDDELETDSDTLDTSNKWARTKNLFKKGNTQGIRFAPRERTKQLDFDSLDNEEEQ